MRLPRTRRVSSRSAEAQEVLALEQDLAALDGRRLRQDAENRRAPAWTCRSRIRRPRRGCARAAARARHDRGSAPRPRPSGSKGAGSGSREAERAHRERLRRGSTMSRRPSPSRLKPSTVRKIARPGKVENHQASGRYCAALGDGEPPVGIGRRRAHAEEAEHRRDQDREAHADGGAHDDGRDAVRQDVEKKDARAARPDALQRVDEERGLEPPRLGVDDAGEEGPVGQRQRQHGALEARRHQLRQRQRQDQLRHGEKHVGDAHDRLGDPSPGSSRPIEPERHADQHRDADHHQRDRERPARAEDDAGEDVAAEVVGAERMSPARRLEAPEKMGGGDVAGVGREQRCEDRDQDDDEHDDQPQDGRLVLRELLRGPASLRAAPAAAGRSARARGRPGCSRRHRSRRSAA